MMATIGLGVTFTDLLGVIGNGRLIARAALANYVVVPAVTVGLLLLLQALTTALRNVGVGLVIATGAFAGSPAVTAALAYGLFEVLGSLLLALAWGRQVSVGTCNRDPTS